MVKGAVFSDCKNHRFQLWRVWDTSKPLIFWMMHNPSTADDLSDDPTIRRIINFSKDWGFGGLYVGNLFSYRATNPKELLKKHLLLLSPLENKKHIEYMINECTVKILAFGNPVRSHDVKGLKSDNWMALKITKTGNPCHPLYLKSDLKPFIYE